MGNSSGRGKAGLDVLGGFSNLGDSLILKSIYLHVALHNPFNNLVLDKI